jgi:hypothetical protein
VVNTTTLDEVIGVYLIEIIASYWSGQQAFASYLLDEF